MFKKQDYINFYEITKRLITLDDINKLINIERLASNYETKIERVKEFIATNNIEGDIISFAKAKQFLKEKLDSSELEKRWMGIKYASDLVWNDNYVFNIEYINAVHRSLLINVAPIGGIWKIKLNQVGSLVTAHPNDVPKLMMNLFTTYLSSRITENHSVFNIIPMISEFLAIHPYEDGNGRMSRLLMNKELYDAGYKFTKYISVSKYLWEERDRYIAALESRNQAWASKNIQPQDLIPLFNVILDALIKAAQKGRELGDLIKYKQTGFNQKIMLTLHKPMSLKEIMSELKISNSKSLITKWLKSLVDNKQLITSGKLKTTKYIQNKY